MQIKREEVSEQIRRQQALKEEIKSEEAKRELLLQISDHDLIKFVQEGGQTKSRSKEEYFMTLINVASSKPSCIDRIQFVKKGNDQEWIVNNRSKTWKK